MKKFKVGIAGYGVVGKKRRHYIDQHPFLTTVALCDQKFDQEGKLENNIYYYCSYEQLLAHDLDILFVCLSNDLAAEVTMAGLERGLHVFCEKPPGRNVEEILNVIACEKKHPTLKLKYGFNHRYHDSVAEALKILRSQKLGRVINLRGVYGKSKLIT